MMLSKLALRNAKRSIKDYMIYLITVTLAFSSIFAFQLIGTAKDVLELSSVMENFKYVMIVVNIFIVMVICFLIHYTIKFMFSKRSKEFGTYMILGIQKKQISNLFTLENIILGFCSLLVSIPIGYLFSIAMSYIIKNIFHLPYQIFINFSFSAILYLLLYFFIIYVIVLFLARKRMKKMKIYDLLYFEKQNEQRKNNHPKVRNIVFIFSLLLGIVTFVLFHHEFRAIGTEPSMSIIFLCFIFIIISIYGVTITLSDFLLNIVLHNKKIKYCNDHLFLARTFSSKVKTMSFTMGTIAVLITMTLISFNLSSLFKGMFDYQLELNAPYDISIETEREKMDEYLSMVEEEYTIEDSFIYDSYKEKNNNVSKLLGNINWRQNDQVIKLSDYNKLLELKGEKKVSLAKGEYLLHVTKEYEDLLRDRKELQEITLTNGKVLKQKSFKATGYTYAWGMGYGSLIVVPDQAIEGLEKEESHLIINTKEKTTEAFAMKLLRESHPDICEEDNLGSMVCYSLSNIIVRGQEEANNNGFITMISFVCFYISFVFIAVVGTILAIQSLSDSTKYQYRYRVLNKLGVSYRKINKTVLKQLFILFFIPIIYPTIISLWAIYSMNQIFQIVLSTSTIYFIYFIMNFGLFLLIYFIYFVATYFGFKKNIAEE